MNKIIKKTGCYFVLLLITLICLLFLIFVILNFVHFGNHNDIISTIESEHYTIYLYNRNFGATTRYNNQIYVVKKGKKLPDKSGNVFTSDDIGVEILLIDNDILLVRYEHEKGKIYKKENKIYGLTVKYEEKK